MPKIIKLLVLGLSFSFLTLTGYLIAKEKSSGGSIAELVKISPVLERVKQPIPFEEITIPYLRNRQYNSRLGNLQKVSENSSYTSYLTSYNSEGFKINALLTEPKGVKPQGGWPAIIFIHGYIPPKQYQTLQNYSSYVDSLAKNGFVVFKIDLRGQRFKKNMLNPQKKFMLKH